MPPVIALTGGIGSGKSSVANMLEKLGAAVIDTDEIAHALTAAGHAGALLIGQEFGAEYLDSAGALNRSRMRELVFSDAPAKQKLESLLHPMIRSGVTARLATCAKKPFDEIPYIVIVVPLLIETGAYRELAQRVLVVDCDEAQQVARVMQRSGLTVEAVTAIMAHQASRQERRRNADDIVRNDGDLQALQEAVEAIHLSYLKLARKPA